MPKSIYFDDQARQSVRKGIDVLAHAVKMTLGPRGRAAIVERGYGAPMVTFDGVTVAKEVSLPDKHENLGVELIKQVAVNTNDAVGDGTTTSVVLAQAMIHAGDELISEEGANVIALTDALNEAGGRIIAALDTMAEPVAGDTVKEVAVLSSKSETIGALVAEVMAKVGPTGAVTIEDSNTTESRYDQVNGFQLDRGFLSPYMQTNPDRGEAVLENAPILVTDQTITSFKDLLPVLESLVAKNTRSLCIIAEDVSQETLGAFMMNKLQGNFVTLIVKAPGYGDEKKDNLQDIAAVTGARFISSDLGMKLAEVTFEQLGSARRIVATKEKTTIVEGGGAPADVETRTAMVRQLLETATGDYQRDKVKDRIARLSGGVAVIKVGGASESAQKELKQRVEDAVNATRAAMEEGVVPGGGVALLRTSLTLGTSPAEEILREALARPLVAIIANSGRTSESTNIQAAVLRNDDPWYGYDAAKGEVCDLKAAGIIDPVKVTKTALRNALSVASSYLMLGTSITDLPKAEPESPLPY